ncbi:RNA directed DNA polymerase (reverse transcriptase) [Echinococcus multilocularis]|uniref:RNA directed DNA polymerase (Reverse transcriptase) n=1 Tax=Echinococcus multilocularis TaxID=6211 RepID=A0A0S4MMB4_ECHMU|nr:RNA directed DNA polymerase (reverse transcriptase) [Echinococcus multilocularis]
MKRQGLLTVPCYNICKRRPNLTSPCRGPPRYTPQSDNPSFFLLYSLPNGSVHCRKPQTNWKDVHAARSITHLQVGLGLFHSLADYLQQKEWKCSFCGGCLLHLPRHASAALSLPREDIDDIFNIPLRATVILLSNLDCLGAHPIHATDSRGKELRRLLVRVLMYALGRGNPTWRTTSILVGSPINRGDREEHSSLLSGLTFRNRRTAEDFCL